MPTTLPVRNVTLDYFKLVLIILAITAHSNISSTGLSGWLLSEGFARVSVPLLFVINGYFLAPIISDKQKVKKYLLNLFVIYMVWNIIYSPLIWDWSGGGKKLLLVCFFLGYYHLWYLAGLLGATILLYVLRNCNIKILTVLAIICYIAGYLIQKAYAADIYIHMYPTISRCFLFFTFPFLFIGYFIHTQKLEEKNFAKTGSKIYLWTIFLFIILLCESYFVYTFKGHESDPPKDDFFIALPLLCPLLFLIVQRIGKYKSDDGYFSKLASGIYFVHILIIYLMLKSPYRADYEAFPYYLFVSFIFSAVLIVLNKRLKVFL